MDRFFHAELTGLRNDLILMGELTLDMLRLSAESLVNADVALSHRVRGMDDSVDELEKRIDREVMRYLTLYGPMGRDVRLLMAARDIGHDLERVADEAAVIARRVITIGERGALNDFLSVPRMAELAEVQVRLALDSFVSLDAEKAGRVRPGDAEIDRLHRENYERVFGLPGVGHAVSAPVVELMFISKGYERAGDHAKNIAEQVVFLLSGEDVRHRHINEERRAESGA